MRSLYPIVLLCFIFFSCAPKNRNSFNEIGPSSQSQGVDNTPKAFFKAIALLDVETVSSYLNNGVNVNTRKNRKTALMLAIITPYFLPSNEDKEKVSSRQTSREDIINERKKQIIQILVEKGAHINARDKNNKTALMLAITTTRKSYDYRKDLLGIEIKISDGQIIFDHNSRYHNFDIWTTRTSEATTIQILQMLINAGANVNLADRYGRTSLMLAVENFFDTIPITQILIDAGADVNATDRRGRTVLIRTLEQAKQISKSGETIRLTILEETIEMLINAGAKSNLVDNCWRSNKEVCNNDSDMQF